MKKTLLTLSTLSGLLIATFTVAVAHAATTTPAPGQALEIAPPVVSLTADPGQVIKPIINLRNVSTAKLAVSGEVTDFTAAGEDGTPKLLLDEKEVNPYSIKTWVSPLAKQTLESRKIFALPVTITVPRNAAPGGYFGVIRFSASAPELDSTGVSLSASLGALVFIRVNGDAKESLVIDDFYSSKSDRKASFFESAPVTFVQRLKDTGNTYLQPAGQVTVKDMFGHAIGATNVNLPPRNILPGSVRKFEQPFDKSVIGNRILFGKYTAELKLTYGDSKQVVNKTISFWVIPYKLIGGVIIGLVILFFLLRTGLRRYNERILRRSRRW